MCLREVEPYPQSTPSVGELVVGLKGPRVLAPLKGPAHRRELRWPSQGWHEPRGAPKVLTPRDGAACQASRSLSLAGVPPARPPGLLEPRGPRPSPRARPRKGGSKASLCQCQLGREVSAPPRQRGRSAPVNPISTPTAHLLPLCPATQQCGRRPGRPSPRETP